MEPQRALILTHARAHLAKGQYVFAKVCESRAACLLVHARVRTRRHAEAIAARLDVAMRRRQDGESRQRESNAAGYVVVDAGPQIVADIDVIGASGLALTIAGQGAARGRGR